MINLKEEKVFERTLKWGNAQHVINMKIQSTLYKINNVKYIGILINYS